MVLYSSQHGVVWCGIAQSVLYGMQPRTENVLEWVLHSCWLSARNLPMEQSPSAMSITAYCMVWFCMVWFCMVWYGVVLYGVVLYGVVLHGVVWCGFVWCGARRLPMEQSPSASQQEPLSHLSPYFLHTYPMSYTPDLAPHLTLPNHTIPYHTYPMSYTLDLAPFL